MRSPAALVVVALVVLVTGSSAQPPPEGRAGAPPSGPWTCPASHPIKGNLTTRTGECIYHVRGGAFYHKTKPEQCFATEDEARADGCRRSRR